jgi:tetratricopeptide (TPR) repeat protein
MFTKILLLAAVFALAGSQATATGEEPESFVEAQKKMESGDIDGAIELFKETVALDESSSVYHTWLGRAYIEKLQNASFYEKGMLSGKALDHLKKAVKLDPENVEARISLAGYYANAPSIAGGSKKKAREQADEIMKYDPVQGRAIMAGVYIKEQKYDLAIDNLEYCTEALPEDTELRYRLGMVYQDQQNYSKAFDVFEQMLEIEPGSPAALYQIGRTAAFSGANVDRGIECLNQYLTIEVPSGYPGPDGARWRLGMLYEHKGDLAAARQQYQTAVELNPDDEKYRKSLKALEQP